MAKQGEKRISRVAVGSERKKNLTRPLRSKHPETPKRLTKSIILSLSIGGVDPRYRRTILSTCLYVDSVALFPFSRQHTHKNELSRIMQLSCNSDKSKVTLESSLREYKDLVRPENHQNKQIEYLENVTLRD